MDFIIYKLFCDGLLQKMMSLTYYKGQVYSPLSETLQAKCVLKFTSFESIYSILYKLS